MIQLSTNSPAATRFLVLRCRRFTSIILAHACISDRFEHLGDTVLGLSVTRMMMDIYPGLRVGPSTVSICINSFPMISSADRNAGHVQKIRAMVVGNSTLAEM